MLTVKDRLVAYNNSRAVCRLTISLEGTVVRILN